MTFSKYKFPADTPIFDTRYKHLESQNNNPFYFFHGQLVYALAHYFADLETTKCNFDKFLTNSLMKPITKDFLYCDADKWTEKLFTIPWGILDNK